MLNFEGLRKSIQASQMSLALKRAIGLNKDTDDEALLDSGASASKDKDPNSKEKDQEEIGFIRGTFLQQMFFKSKYGALSQHYPNTLYSEYFILLFLTDILEEQNELNEKIMAVEKERLDATVDLLYSKMEVAKEFAVTKQIYKDIISSDDQHLEDDLEEMDDNVNDENADNSNSELDDEERQLQRKNRKGKKNLAREEARLNQMK